ncbi:hypothetical protein C7974DRAFT_428732 [Boeremia exigua]|uniref:uncharacterized protein n=1 Tax=Boeremia exigua TaxID=749465 RepID=UPI001E8D11EC|nr:uncharacterized protein C7974DRAFT_428732 [Boeremia exigua]KAH6612969.1 hypothetical protein C7974DRAFT_428732 [Boeremia exigua]
MWKIDPSAATLRRAYKLADFFGAIILAMPDDLLNNEARIKEIPLSGFDSLKNSDVVWLQKAWSSHTKFLLDEKSDRFPPHVDLSCILGALPAADQILAAQPVQSRPEMSEAASNSPSWVPSSFQDPPPRIDIWHFASCGAKLCPTGCFSLREEIVQSQHDAVLSMQKSLKHNQLLRTYGDAENLRVHDSLAVLCGRSAYPDLVKDLLKGLANQRIRIFAGLDSGFTLPDDGGHFWAVADITQDKFGTLLDIHISLKASNDVSTIWHTFLSYNGVPRLQRFEEELLLTSRPETEGEAQLPLSITKDLESCSESELLYLVEQIRISECNHSFNHAILEAAEHYLVQDPDQAGVFAELWVLGSQCEIYFGLSPRTLGDIAYNKYQLFLSHNPPPEDSWDGKEVFTAYSVHETSKRLLDTAPKASQKGTFGISNAEKRSGKKRLTKYREGAAAAGALSIFCFPAIIDVVLLTFLGRGLYLTAFMNDEIKVMADYAIMTALILTGGITGFVGSTGGFYLFNAAFDNLAHFMVQRFSACMVLTSIIALCGLIAFGVQSSWFGGLIFVLYLFPLSIFLTILGIFATMHRQGSFLSSGRIEMWKFVPILFISPVLTTFVPNWDLPIYLSVIYTFTFGLLTAFRRLCNEWTSWHLRIPSITEKDMVQWYQDKYLNQLDADDVKPVTAARLALTAEVCEIEERGMFWKLWNRGGQDDKFVEPIARNLRVIEFLLATHSGGEEVPELFSSSWFVQCGLALNNKRQMMRGLKEHSAFIQYRYSRYDIGQNVGLFLLALLDRLVSTVMSARLPLAQAFKTTSTRYAIGFALLHFLCGAVAVDVVLQKQWGFVASSSKKKLKDLNEVNQAIENNEMQHRERYRRALIHLMSLLLLTFGTCTIFHCLLVDEYTTSILFFSEPAASLVDLANHGARRTLRGNLIKVDRPREKFTGFIARSHTNLLGVMVYKGLYDVIPKRQSPIAVAFYDARNRLYRRLEILGGLEKTYHYDDKSPSRWPISKTTIQADWKLETRYDKFGRPVSGQQLRNGVVFDYEYRYKHRSVGDSDLVCATYKSADNTVPALLTVYWCVRPTATSDRIDRWIPSNKVQAVQAAFFSGQTYEVRWIYKHAQGADIEASVYHEGMLRPCFPPAEIMQDKYGLLEKPKQFCFDDEDLLIYHSSISLQRMIPSKRGYLAKAFNAVVSTWPFRYLHLGEVVSYHKLSSSALRSALWDSWQKAPYIDALTASFVDELILRKEPLLREYWQLRDSGFLRRAAEVLDQGLEQIVSAIEPTYESSSKCPLIIKPADLFIMGLGKDANQMTSRLDYAYSDSETATSVIFSDNGCWPDSPGGVSNCRRDLVDGHKTIKGHCLAESANDFGVPRYQIERNIASLKVLPLWGLDSKTAYHGILDNLLQTQVDDKISQTKLGGDIEQIFIPLLRDFVRGARSKRYTRKDLTVCSNVFLKMNKYFETCDFNKTWQSNQVREAWMEAWLVEYDDPNIWNFKDHSAILHPSLNDFQEALNLYIAYFFIYSVNLPSPCPTVFQTTNHGIGSLYGMLLKYQRGTTWGLWDHAILWRETCLNISPAQCLLPLPVQTMLLAGIKLSCHLAYTHVDIILPCTSVFNPDWEQDLGTDQGLRGSKKVFARKIDPIVNGIGNMDLFEPITEVRSKFPTTVMLSNVQFIKDVKTAVLAADVIVNKYGFKDYQLVVYGAQDRQPSYVLETVQLINTRGLASNVTLAGFGSPKEVLKDAWLFLNSSLSEGLPLAIGEAALSGVPIVATEVGATSLVLTDPDDMKKRYGEVVPPNDPESLARAQLSILAMMGAWADYTQTAEPAPLPYSFTAEDVTNITKRMYEKVEDRRKLGLKLREVVLRSFHGHRYLREHEQMFWIQRRRAEIRRSSVKIPSHPQVSEVYGQSRLFQYDSKTEESGPHKMRWQPFKHPERAEKKQDEHDVERKAGSL